MESLEAFIIYTYEICPNLETDHPGLAGWDTAGQRMHRYREGPCCQRDSHPAHTDSLSPFTHPDPYCSRG